MKKNYLFLTLFVFFLSVFIFYFGNKEAEAECLSKCNQHWGWPVDDSHCEGAQPFWDSGSFTTGACAVNTTSVHFDLSTSVWNNSCNNNANNQTCQTGFCPTSGFGVTNMAPCAVWWDPTGDSDATCKDSIVTVYGRWNSVMQQCIQCDVGLTTGRTYGTSSSLDFGPPTVFKRFCGSDTACEGKVATNACNVGSWCESKSANCVSGDICNGSGSCYTPTGTPTLTPSVTPTPTPGGDWIRFNLSGTYHSYDCVTNTDFTSSSFNGSSGGGCTGTWQNCGTGSPSSGSYDCFVGFIADCTNPAKRCPIRYYAGDCDCITPTPTVTATATSTVTFVSKTVLGCSCGGPCPFGATINSCSLADLTVNTFCTANPTCTLILSSNPNCDCTTVFVTGTPTVTATATVTGTAAPGTTCGIDTPPSCKLGCLPQDPDCAAPGCTISPSGVTICNPTLTNSFDMLVQNVTGWILGIIGSLALLFLIIGGIMYIGAGGDQDRIKTAKTIVTAVVIGLIVVIASYSIINEIKKILGY